ncbi:MAG: macro domain-containing protein [Phycisphaerales bacterium]|jgi:O-acetyl-ADP-ribose deacetylase (regulator of RNase III)
MPPVIEAILDDITTLRVDAIVNAANEMLAPGGGVCGAIHKAAGPRLEDACLELPEVRPGVRCEPGSAIVTRAFELPARCVIHTVGPVWVNGRSGEDDTLARCYRSCLELCRKGKIGSIAFPAISTGVYGFPSEYAAIIAVRTIAAAITPTDDEPDPFPKLASITLCAFDDQTLALYRQQLAAAELPQDGARGDPNGKHDAAPAG